MDKIKKEILKGIRMEGDSLLYYIDCFKKHVRNPIYGRGSELTPFYMINIGKYCKKYHDHRILLRGYKKIMRNPIMKDIKDILKTREMYPWLI